MYEYDNVDKFMKFRTFNQAAFRLTISILLQDAHVRLSTILETSFKEIRSFGNCVPSELYINLQIILSSNEVNNSCSQIV